MKIRLLLLISICVLAITEVNAQSRKNKTLVGMSSNVGLGGAGVMSLGHSKITLTGQQYYNEVKLTTTSLSAIPRIGYFFGNNFVLGIDANLGYVHSKINNEFNNSETIFALGPFARYYIGSGVILPFIELNGSIGSQNYKYLEGWPTQREKKDVSSLSMFGGGVGMAIPIGSRAFFDIMANYNSLVQKEQKSSRIIEKDLMKTIGLKLGFVFLLGADEN